MAEMRRYFEMDNDANPSSHWLSANAVPPETLDPSGFRNNFFDYNTNLSDTVIDPLEHDPEYTRRMMEFETTLQDKLQEELKEEELIFVQKWTNTGLQIVALITEHVVSHPFIVLRRQCQVNNKLSRYHLVPVTLIPIVVNLHRWQGITCLWKGVGSVLIIKGLQLAIQDLVSKLTQWPKEITLDSSIKYVSQHILLKFVTCAVITPFYSASLLETVQSDIASEKPEFLDVFKEGLRRLISFGVPQKGRMLPVWSLIMPTAVYFIFRHIFTLFMKTVISKLLILNQDLKHQRQGAIPKDLYMKDSQSIELMSTLVSVLSADIVMYPFETILHRLHLQGTRTIIDNLDNGLSVTPILTNFEGVLDCYETTVREEGPCGLYKGFGALLLQCLTYTSVIKLSKSIFTRVSLLFCKNDSSSHSVVDKHRERKFQLPNPKSQKHNKMKKKGSAQFGFSSDSDEYDNTDRYTCQKTP